MTYIQGSSGTADAGADQFPNTLALVTLDGSGSSAGTYAWTLTRRTPLGVTSDATVLLSSTTAQSPTFTPEFNGYLYTATITVDAGPFDSCAVQISDYLLLDMTGATEQNTAQRGAGYALGTSNTVDLVNHGRNDAGMDAWTAYQSVGALPAGAIGLKGRVTGTLPGANGTGNSAGVGVVVMNDAYGTQLGHHSAIMLSAAANVQRSTVSRFGTALTLNNLASVDRVEIRSFVNSTGNIAAAQSLTVAEGAPVNVFVNVDTNALGGTATTFHVGFEGIIISGAPAAGFTVTDVVVEWGWIWE